MVTTSSYPEGFISAHSKAAGCRWSRSLSLWVWVRSVWCCKLKSGRRLQMSSKRRLLFPLFGSVPLGSQTWTAQASARGEYSHADTYQLYRLSSESFLLSLSGCLRLVFSLLMRLTLSLSLPLQHLSGICKKFLQCVSVSVCKTHLTCYLDHLFLHFISVSFSIMILFAVVEDPLINVTDYCSSLKLCWASLNESQWDVNTSRII